MSEVMKKKMQRLFRYISNAVWEDECGMIRSRSQSCANSWHANLSLFGILGSKDSGIVSVLYRMFHHDTEVRVQRYWVDVDDDRLKRHVEDKSVLDHLLTDTGALGLGLGSLNTERKFHLHAKGNVHGKDVNTLGVLKSTQQTAPHHGEGMNPFHPRRSPVKIVHLRLADILTQLYVEEALFRQKMEGNWLVINDGVKEPAIVLGISGRPETLVHQQEAQKLGVPLVRRFTGGGTVVVDEDTVMMSIIMNGKKELPHVACYPRQVMEWCAGFLEPHLRSYGAFALREHDFVLGNQKIGGNAQAISGPRWLHHTSFLFHYTPERMALLKQPPKSPDYRQDRTHTDFITTLQQRNPNRENFIQGIMDCVHVAGFCPVPATLDDIIQALRQNTVCGTRLL